MARALERWRARGGLAREERRSPVGEMTRIEQQMHDMFDRFFREAWQPVGFRETWQPFGLFEGGASGPAIDLLDRDDELVLRADLPGLEQKDVEVEVRDGTLMLHGQRAEEREERERGCYCAERWTGEFTRTIPLPAEVDADKAAASFKSGILEVHLPKAKQAKESGKKVEIRTQ